jgi:hypothetical protein
MKQLIALTPPLFMLGLGFVLTFIYNIPWYVSFFPFILGFGVVAGFLALTLFSIYVAEEKE